MVFCAKTEEYGGNPAFNGELLEDFDPRYEDGLPNTDNSSIHTESGVMGLNFVRVY